LRWPTAADASAPRIVHTHLRRFAKQLFEEQRDVLRAEAKEIVVEGGAISSITLNEAFCIGIKLSPR
jgi:hypothetical protein